MSLSTNCTDKRVKCRVCASDCFKEMLLSYTNMPSSAQGFPELEDLENDCGSDLNLFQCSSCSLVQLNNQPVSYYKEVIRAAAFSDEMKEFRSEQFASWVEKYLLTRKNVIEVGCGRGEYLSILGKAGVGLAHGIEYSKQAVNACRVEGYSVTKGFFGDKNFTLPESKYDGFVCLNFMEHWPDPNRVLEHLKHNLSEDAVGIIEVPNFDMILKKGLYSEFISDHLLYFTKDTLTFVLNYNGFEVIECSEIWYDYILSAVVRRRRKTDLSLLGEYRSKIQIELDSFIDQFGENKVAVWGAGHQSLAVMSLANLSGRIRYVVDSAPFKQNKFTPATHIPIVSPKELKNDPVEAVIIIAASYSNEVVKIMKNLYGQIGHVAVLEDKGLRIIY